MNDTNPPEDKLPVTAELGDEGGSYGDATNQAETFAGTQGNRRVDPNRVGSGESGTPTTASDYNTDDLTKHTVEPPERKKR